MWPRTIFIRGIGVPVESWEEIDELIKRHGSDVARGKSSGKGVVHPPIGPTHGSGSLSPSDRELLKSFVDKGKRGLLNKEIGQALGRKGKTIRRGLIEWANKVGLINPREPLPFEPTIRPEGRGFRMKDHFIRVGQSLLGEG